MQSYLSVILNKWCLDSSVYLRVQEGSENCNGSTQGIDGQDFCVKDDDRGYNNSDTLHGITDAKCERRNLVQWHVRHLIVQVIKHTLCHDPPAYQQSSAQVKHQQDALATMLTYLQKTWNIYLIFSERYIFKELQKWLFNICRIKHTSVDIEEGFRLPKEEISKGGTMTSP